MTKRYDGDTIRNPLLVLRDENIPRRFTFRTGPPGTPNSTQTFTKNPSEKFYPLSPEFPDVPMHIVIDAEDIRKLYPEEEIGDDVLAYFIISSIRMAPLLEKVRDMNNADALRDLGYYFVGEVWAANYCGENTEPFINEYYLNTSKPLEVHLGGRNLSENVQKVIFEYPNGVIKEAKVIQGTESSGFLSEANSGDPQTIVTRDEIYRMRGSEAEEKQYLRDAIAQIINENRVGSIDMSILDEVTEPGKSGQPFYIDKKEVIDSLIRANVDLKFKKMQVIGGTDASLQAFETIATSAAVGFAVGGIFGAVVGAFGSAAASVTSALENQVNIYKDQYNIFNYAIPVDLSRDANLQQN